MTDKLREEIAEWLCHKAIGRELKDATIFRKLASNIVADEIASIVEPHIARARADALEEAAQHLIDEELDNAEVYAAAIRALKEKP